MRTWLILLLIHIGLVATACFLLTVMTWGGPQPDANIGAAMVLFGGLGGLALPWSLLTFNGVLPEQRNSVEMILFVSFALFNVLLHCTAALWFTRSSRAAQTSAPSDGLTSVA